MKTVSVKLVPGFQYQQEVKASGHTLISDVTVANGGADGGPDPKDLVLGGLGSCIAMTVLMVAPRKKWDIKSISVTVSQSDEAVPGKTSRRFLLTEEIEVEGNLSQKELDEIKLTAQKCPVFKLLTEPKRTVTSIKLNPSAPSTTPPQSGPSATSNGTPGSGASTAAPKQTPTSTLPSPAESPQESEPKDSDQSASKR